MTYFIFLIKLHALTSKSFYPHEPLFSFFYVFNFILEKKKKINNFLQTWQAQAWVVLVTLDSIQKWVWKNSRHIRHFMNLQRTRKCISKWEEQLDLQCNFFVHFRIRNQLIFNVFFLIWRPFFLFARHSDTKFYEDYWYLYPEKPQNCDYNVLINKMVFFFN